MTDKTNKWRLTSISVLMADKVCAVIRRSTACPHPSVEPGVADASGRGKRKRHDATGTVCTQDLTPHTNGSATPSAASVPQGPVPDDEERRRRAEELLRQEKERVAERRRERERPRKKHVVFDRRMPNRFTAPVVSSRYEHYCQWYERYAGQFAKDDAEDDVERARVTKLIREGRSVTSIYEEAQALEALAPSSSRSKYNPRNNLGYASAAPEPFYIPTFFRPTPPQHQEEITPHVPRHRQAQPERSSLLKRTSRRVADAAWEMGARAMGAMRSMVEGFANFVGSGHATASSEGAAERDQPVGALDSGSTVSDPASGLRARTAANARSTVAPVAEPAPSAIVDPPPPAVIAPPEHPVDDEDEKLDTEDRFYQAPPPAMEDDEEEDAFTQMTGQSRGAALAQQRAMSAKSGKAPEVVVHSTRDLDAAPVVPAALPEIGTGASQPLTRDNTAFNAAGLDFVPLGVDDEDDKDLDGRANRSRVISRLPSNASRAQVEAAQANERYRIQEARYELQRRQWEEYLRSLGSLGAHPDVQPFRPADSWRDSDSDSEENEDQPDRRRGRGNVARGRDRERAYSEDEPDDKSHPRLRSPPPERQLPDPDGEDEDEKADFDNTVGGRLRQILQQYNKRYEPQVADSDDSDAENPDFAGIQLDEEAERAIDEMEDPELGYKPMYGSGFNRDRTMPKMRRPNQDRERQQEADRRAARRQRELDEQARRYREQEGARRSRYVQRGGGRRGNEPPGRSTYGGW